MGLSTDKILNVAASLSVKMAGQTIKSSPIRHLDIGSGHGELIEILRSKTDLASSACDYTEKLMKLGIMSKTQFESQA